MMYIVKLIQTYINEKTESSQSTKLSYWQVPLELITRNFSIQNLTFFSVHTDIKKNYSRGNESQQLG